MNVPLTQDRLKELLRYDPETGVFTWKGRTGSVAPGRSAGWLDKDGYRCIQIDGRSTKAHRLASLYVSGAWPVGEIDHVNGRPDDNRSCNLRPATHPLNGRNQRKPKNNTSGFKGVSFHRQSGKWSASIKVNYRGRHLGLFNTPEAASGAYESQASLLFGQYKRQIEHY